MSPKKSRQKKSALLFSYDLNCTYIIIVLTVTTAIFRILDSSLFNPGPHHVIFVCFLRFLITLSNLMAQKFITWLTQDVSPVIREVSTVRCS